MVYRIPTQITGFDEMIEGGLPVGSIVLLAGNAGSGKTLFSSHLIKANSTYGKSLYCGFFEKKEHFIDNAEKFGFDFKRLEKEGKLVISEFFPILEEGITMLVSAIESDLVKIKPSLLIIDSVSTLAGDIKGRQEVRMLLKMIDQITKSQNVTVILVTELPLNVSEVGFGVEEFMADSIIMMRYVEVDGIIKRCLAVMKMRETNHDMNIHEYVIKSKGIEVKDRMKGVEGLMITSSKLRSNYSE
ncbi:MAG: RAD55 family ATPase [Nitrososphaerota archaeon]